MLRKALLLFLVTFIVGCQTTPGGNYPGYQSHWHKKVDAFYQQNGESDLLPYVQTVRYFDDVSEAEICDDKHQDKLEQALTLNPTSLFVYTIKFECANRQENQQLAAENREKVSAIAKAITRGRTGVDTNNAIEIREIDEAYILLELSGAYAFGYEIEPKQDTFVYKFHIFDIDENQFQYRYFDNSRFLRKMYSDINDQPLSESQSTLLTLTSLQEERAESVLIPIARYQLRTGNYQKAIELLTQVNWPSALVETMLAEAYHKTGDQAAVEELITRIKEHSINGYVDASVFLAAFELVSGEADINQIRSLLNEVDQTVKKNHGAFLLAKTLSGYSDNKTLLSKWLNQENKPAYWLQLTSVAKQIRKESGGHSGEFALLSLAAEQGSADALWRLAVLHRDGRYTPKDLELALSYLKKSAESGYASAQLDLGYYYDTGGLGLNRDLKLAFYWYQQAANQGHATAQHNLGLFYESGRYVKRDARQAIYHFEQAIRRGYNNSYCALGDIYTANPQIMGLEKAMEFYLIGAEAGVTECMDNLGYFYSNKLKDQDSALKWYQLAAEKGSGYALNSLGRMYEYGVGVNKDYNKAFDYYERGAKQKYPSAITNLGLFYSRGWGAEKDRQKALELYRQAFSMGNYASAFNLGNAYYYGDGVEKDWQTAAEYYQKAADLGYPFALCIAGTVNRENKQVEQALKQLKAGANKGLDRCQWELGVLFEVEKQDYQQAKLWYEKAAEKQNSDAYYNLGLLYENGYLGDVDYESAIKYYHLAVELENGNALANLGFMYEIGKGVEINKALAFEYYLRSAEKGNDQGINNAATFYFHGIATEQDLQKGLELYRQAAEQNNEFALNNLGKAYRDGKGVEADHKLALNYFERSLELGFKAAYEAAGLMYYRGQGTETDYAKALEYLKVAAEAGLEVSSYYVGEIYSLEESGLKDIGKSIEYYILSAEQGDKDAPHYLGEIYNKALSVPRDVRKAQQWYEKAVKLKNAFSYKPLAAIYWEDGQEQQAHEVLKEYADMQDENFYFVMGVFFHFSDYVEADYALAYHYYRLGAEAGDSGSINNLAELYRFGNDIKVDYSKAIELYQQAEKLGSVHAMFNLAEMHRDGHGFEVNLKKAFRLFNKAAQEGFSDAMYQLALMYQDGKGTPANNELAYQWLQKSAEEGFQPAIEYLRENRSQMR